MGRTVGWVLLSCLAVGLGSSLAAPRSAEFARPPPAARPWVYAFWMEGNVTQKGITSDLEAMAREGVGGLLLMDGALGNPNGPYRFMSPSWRQMFAYMVTEAGRLGLKVDVNDGPGWSGSGGPWVKPEQATQQVITSETIVDGPIEFSGVLAKPGGIRQQYYKDIAVIAYPAPGRSGKSLYRIPGYTSSKSFAGGDDFAGVVTWPRNIATAVSYPPVPANQRVESTRMLDLTGKMDVGGRLTWKVPPGRWLVLRFGHTVANGGTRSAQAEASGLETDKLSKAAMDAQFAAMDGKLSDDVGVLTGKTLVSIHVDSWEAGSGNWTDGFREEFRQRNGYDLLPFMPTLDGIVVDNREVSERFLWDFRETISELVLENYAAHLRALAHRKGLMLSIEAYDGTTADLPYGGRADEPMTEFWPRPIYNGVPMGDLTEEMASVAHVYGKPILGAEAFTSRWGDFLDDPATLKPMADWSFSSGVNRLYYSEWVMQPWPDRKPGVAFMDVGTVFGAGLTWWDQSKAWNDYVARAQYMLQQGRFVADVCFIAPEGAPQRFTPPIPANIRGGIPSRPSYNFDECPPEVVLEARVEHGRVALPSGMRYRILVLPSYNADDQPVVRLMDVDDYYYKPAPLPKVRTMTPRLLRRVKQLLEAGATVLGTRPLASPSLIGYPECDAEVTRLADEIWGRNAGASGTGQRKVGKGMIIWGRTPASVLAGMGVPPDFATNDNLEGKLNYTHRRTADGTDVYFVVNQQDAPVQGDVFFRVSGRQPEWWWPQSGRVERAAVFEQIGGVTKVPISLAANESVFVVFRQRPGTHFVAINPTGESQRRVHAGGSHSPTDDAFEVAAWVKPQGEIPLPRKRSDGWAYADKDIQVPGAGFQTVTSPGRGRGGFAVGMNGVVVFLYGQAGEIEPLLVYSKPFGSFKPARSRDPIQAAPGVRRVLIGVVYKDRTPYLFVNGSLVAKGPESRFPSRGGGGWADRRTFAGDLAALDSFESALASSGHRNLLLSTADRDALPAVDVSHRLFWRSGTYVLSTADGKGRERIVKLPPAQPLQGRWDVQFDPKWGGPRTAWFDRLESWSLRPEKGIRFYSGTAVYRQSFRMNLQMGTGDRVYLDLGKVAVMADVVLNGKDFGVLWNAPYRVDVTEAIHLTGENVLEVKVVNLWVNCLIGDEQLPEDSERDADGALKSWPRWVASGAGSPTGRYTFTSRRIWRGSDPLVESGLLGPVRVLAAQTIE